MHINGTHGAIGEDVLVENELLWKDIVQVPFERMTVQTSANTSTAFHVAEIFALGHNDQREADRCRSVPEDRADACSRSACNRPSRLRPDAWNFDREHRLCLRERRRRRRNRCRSGSESISRTFRASHVVRVTRAEDVTNARAGHEFETTTAHPNPEGDFEIFTSPDLKK